MSIDSAKLFLKTVRKNESLRSRIDALAGSDVLAQMVRLAQSEGFDFTLDEYRDAVVLESEGELEVDALNETLEQLGLDRIQDA
jgi:predicted ribosomally synthesized peptide with nif11-like leader